MISAPRGRSGRFALSAAGFMATRTLGASPGVRISKLAKWTWKLETPGSVPAGARISAGKFGKVEMSLPSWAISEVNRSPVSCMPSPESPAKRITTRSSWRICLLVTWTGLLEGTSVRFRAYVVRIRHVHVRPARPGYPDSAPGCDSRTVLGGLGPGYAVRVHTYLGSYATLGLLLIVTALIFVGAFG